MNLCHKPMTRGHYCHKEDGHKIEDPYNPMTSCACNCLGTPGPDDRGTAKNRISREDAIHHG